MRQYHSDNKNYNAILDAMAQIRQNQLNESYGYYAEAEHEDEEMQEAMHGDEDEMREAMHREAMHGDEDEMQEGHGGDITPEEAEELGALIDDVLAEEFEEDDLNESISLDEADKNKKSKVRSFLKGVALAGLLGAGGTAVAYGLGRDPGVGSLGAAERAGGMSPTQRALSRIGSGYSQMGGAALTGAQAAGTAAGDAAVAVGNKVQNMRNRRASERQNRAFTNMNRGIGYGNPAI